MSIWGKLPPWAEWAVLILIALLGLWVLDLVPNPKRITEYVINAFVIGAVLGSVITYFYVTHEKRIISKVRRDVDSLAAYVDLSHLTPRQRAQVDYPNAELVSDKRILEIHDWAWRYKKSNWPRPKKNKGKIHPIRLAALIIVCEELLGLSSADALQANEKAKYLDDLRTLLQPKASTNKQANPHTTV